MYFFVSYLPALQSCSELKICGEWSTAGYTVFYTLNRVMWGIWVCWLIFACSHGYGGIICASKTHISDRRLFIADWNHGVQDFRYISGFVNTFLSWKFWVPIGKLTYLGYLIHEIFVYVYAYGSPNQTYYYDYYMVGIIMQCFKISMIFFPNTWIFFYF